MNNCYLITLGSQSINYTFQFDSTSQYFNGFITKNPSCSSKCKSLRKEIWDEWVKIGNPINAYSEYTLTSLELSDRLLEHNHCIIHAVAFSYRGKAWLITAPSGTGKSTQIKNLQIMAPGEFHIICGDRPVLEIIEDSDIIVHPSPWNGKENWKGAPAAVLAGIICLQRTDTNEFMRWTPGRAALSVFGAIIHTGINEENIKATAEFANVLLKTVPIYRLSSFSVPDSTKLLYEHLFKDKGAFNGV